MPILLLSLALFEGQYFRAHWPSSDPALHAVRDQYKALPLSWRYMEQHTDGGHIPVARDRRDVVDGVGGVPGVSD